MANELTCSLAYSDSEGSDEALTTPEFNANVGTKKYIKAKQAIGITEEAINLGEVTSPGMAYFINRDSTNYVELKVGAAGAIFAKLLPEESWGPGRLGGGAQAPYAIANASPVQLEYLIVNT